MDRHKIAFGFLKGFGAKVGAVGLTTNLDENTLMIVGSDDDDMALCANALLRSRRRHRDRRISGQVLEKIDFPLRRNIFAGALAGCRAGASTDSNAVKRNGLVFRQAHFCVEFLTVRNFARAQDHRARFDPSEGAESRFVIR